MKLLKDYFCNHYKMVWKEEVLKQANYNNQGDKSLD